MRGRIDILGIPVDALTRHEVLERCAEFLRGSVCQQIITANPEFALWARRDPVVRDVAARADLVVADGVGLVWAAQLMHRRIPERVSGVGLVWDLCRLAAPAGQRVYFLGGRDGVAAGAAENVQRGLPANLRAYGFALEHDARRVPEAFWAELARVRPAVLFVAYGQPTQELWIAANRERLAACGVRIAVGVGGAVDTIAGRLPRAPRWMRAAGLEWLWRLLVEPRRIPRTFQAVVLFPLSVLSDMWRGQRQ